MLNTAWNSLVSKKICVPKERIKLENVRVIFLFLIETLTKKKGRDPDQAGLMLQPGYLSFTKCVIRDIF